MNKLLETIAVTGLGILVFGVILLFTEHSSYTAFSSIATGFGMSVGSLALKSLIEPSRTGK